MNLLFATYSYPTKPGPWMLMLYRITVGLLSTQKLWLQGKDMHCSGCQSITLHHLPIYSLIPTEFLAVTGKAQYCKRLMLACGEHFRYFTDSLCQQVQTQIHRTPVHALPSWTFTLNESKIYTVSMTLLFIPYLYDIELFISLFNILYCLG